jgi:hypothetical protein
VKAAVTCLKLLSKNLPGVIVENHKKHTKEGAGALAEILNNLLLGLPCNHCSQLGEDENGNKCYKGSNGS